MMPKRSGYFSLFRLLATMRGGSSKRSENNWIEAHGVGWMIYLVSFAFGAQLIWSQTVGWKFIVDLIALAFAIWLAWLIILYFNLLLIRLLRLCGVCREISNRAVQSVLILALTTALALQLARSDSWLRVIGMGWLLVVAANFFSFLVLSLIDNGGTERN
jgi:hypothetical protein